MYEINRSVFLLMPLEPLALAAIFARCGFKRHRA